MTSAPVGLSLNGRKLRLYQIDLDRADVRDLSYNVCSLWLKGKLMKRAGDYNLAAVQSSAMGTNPTGKGYKCF